MTLSIIKLFPPQALSTGATTIFTCPGPSTTVLKNGRVRLTNFDSSAHAVSLYTVPSGGAVSSTYACMSSQSLAAGSYTDLDIPTMAVGDVLKALADAGAVVNIQELGGVLFS